LLSRTATALGPTATSMHSRPGVLEDDLRHGPKPERIGREVMCRSAAGREVRVTVYPDNTIGPGAVLLSVAGSATLRLIARQSRSIGKALSWVELESTEYVGPASQSEEP
jgi:hypothetical protein